jgi:hypothetical protein
MDRIFISTLLYKFQNYSLELNSLNKRLKCIMYTADHSYLHVVLIRNYLARLQLTAQFTILALDRADGSTSWDRD